MTRVAEVAIGALASRTSANVEVLDVMKLIGDSLGITDS